jgi:hypothetical protein
MGYGTQEVTEVGFRTVKKPSKKELRKTICCFAKSYGVKRVVFNNRAKYINGSFNSTNCVIFISTTLCKKDTLSTFFHELGHFEAVKNGMWNEYHANVHTNAYTAEEKFYIEHGIDKIAMGLWNKYVNTKVWGKYTYTYKLKNKRYFVEWFNNEQK